MSKPVSEILSSRGKEYGDRFVNLECIGELKAVYHKYAGGMAQGHMTPTRRLAFDHCMEMVMVKIARIATGLHKTDNYDDAMGYLELARSMVEGIDR